ncbi:PilN domain-containing protein [Catenovulum adriaticum]|uniref:PilN domain-containing protein n=1 Tax=Catenovulum adriaticum TaxID=2984846 RepID=A0ABY7ALS9_9ALTE|nr:PilN domain-containing protein [Catenovulum sp. TS8]WAJ70260.1 PilN domain-containing protein [Catenovulum sp. TS8]
MPHINLLPWREQDKQRKQKIYITILTLVAILAFSVMLLINTYYNSLISNQQTRNQYLNNEIAVLDSKIKEIKELKTKRKNLEQRMELIADLQRNRNLGAQIMDELVKVVPAGIYLVSLEKKGRQVTIQGKSESNNRVSTMMRNIEASYLLERPVLNAIVSAQSNEALNILSDFTMSFDVQSAGLEREQEGQQ